MAQVSPQYCPQCGTEVVPQQKFCATCGLPRAALDLGQAGPSSSDAPVFAGGPQLPASQPQAQNVATLDTVALPPNRKRKIGRNGIVLLLIALFLVVIAAGYGILQSLGVGKPTQSPISRININTTASYASVDMTIFNVQQAQNFLDDPNSVSDGMRRVQIRAKNTFSQPIALSYSTIAHLLLPGGKEVAAVYASSNAPIAPNATQTTNIDFALPLSIKTDQLSLRLGTANEAQLDIPLNGSTDGSKYAPKAVKIAKSLSYLSTNWTLVDATSQLSFNGQQASKDMRFVTVRFSIDNPLMQSVILGSPYTYMHLKTNTTDRTPVSAGAPISLDAGVSGKTGSATFQVPQESSTLTLTLSPLQSSGFDPATTTFQL